MNIFINGKRVKFNGEEHEFSSLMDSLLARHLLETQAEDYEKRIKGIENDRDFWQGKAASWERDARQYYDDYVKSNIENNRLQQKLTSSTASAILRVVE